MSKALEPLIFEIAKLPADKHDRELIIQMKRKWAKENGQSNVPTNMQLLKTYQWLIADEQLEHDQEIIWLLRKRSVRSMSGIVPIQVLTKPFRCPGKCIFCPNDASMPKSYINTQPGAMRALLNNFDPYKQCYNRLLSLMLTGHPTDKIEMIVLGGTRDVYPKSYKIEFVKWLYDACNHFDEFLAQIDIDYTNPKAARWTKTEDIEIQYPETIEESIKINETAKHRIIWLTVETRPEYVTHENCQFWRELGVTRLEMWIQTLHNDVHEANVRGHGNEEIRQAMHTLRQYAFKVSTHIMPGLYTSTLEKDLETFQIAYSSPYIKPDEIKFYPTAVIPNTPLFDLFKEWKYQPLTDEALEQIVRDVQVDIIPPYTRIKRLARDFDTNEVVAWANTPNLRQLVMRDLQKEYDADESLRIEQYSKLKKWKLKIENRKTISEIRNPNSETWNKDSEIWNLKSEFENMEDLLNCIVEPMNQKTTTVKNLSWEEWELDGRIETYTVWWSFDTSSQRNFVCLCTRSREVKNKEAQNTKRKNDKAKKCRDNASACLQAEGLNHEQQKENNWKDFPFLVVRRYRSTVGEEMFISFEDSLWYLYGFTRLLLPDENKSIDWPWLGEGTALIRELHVYWSLAKIESRNEDWESRQGNKKVQHTGFWRQLMDLAEKITWVRWYEKLSVISGVGVRKYYEKLGFELEGTYMTKLIRS